MHYRTITAGRRSPTSYDVIIIGAGSAGGVLATRLSEDDSRSVLLLEAGPHYGSVAGDLPSDISGSRTSTSSHDWGYTSEPGILGEALRLDRGKIVRGSSATNSAIATRGLPGDYDGWASGGNPGWAFDEVLPYFRRLEHDLDFGDPWHGDEGPIPIRRYNPEELAPAQRAFLEACSAAGHPGIADHNGPGARGAGPVPLNRVGGVRQSTALTYLAAARGRPNLTVRGNVLVDRVLFEGDRAVGVRLADPPEVLSAGRVALAAGAYGSPQILMRSGVGSVDLLRELGITARLNLPGVRQNLRDHPLLRLSFGVEGPAQTPKEPVLQTLLTAKSTPEIPGFDLQIFPSGPNPTENGALLTLLVSVIQPHSRGELRLRSAQPDAAPRIDLGHFTHPDDLPRMLTGVRTAREIAGTEPLANLVREELWPGPIAADDAALAEAALSRMGTYHHAVGTCRMGPSTDTEAVVDTSGKVQGAENLHVIDASIMPCIPSANTNLPTMMVAERCAAWLSRTGT